MSEFSAVRPILYDALDLLTPEEITKAEKYFYKSIGVDKKHTTRDDRMLLEEWLLFEWRDKKNNGLLQRALDAPHLTNEQLRRCQDLLQTQLYSYWSVENIILGYGFTIVDLYGGDKYKIRASELSRQVNANSFFAARITQIDGRWHICSGSVSMQSLRFSEGSKESLFAEKPVNFGIIDVRANRSKRQKSDLTIPLDNAKQQFQHFLEETGLNKYISVDTVLDWFASQSKSKNNKDPGERAMIVNLLMGVAYGIPVDDASLLLQLYSTLQRAALDSKAIKEDVEPAGKELYVFETDPDSWRDNFDIAKAKAHSGDQEGAFAAYEHAFRVLHKNYSTFPDIYRFVYNSGVAVMYSDFELSKLLVALSLDLNPKYDLAIDLIRRMNNGELDDTVQKAQLIKMLKQMKELSLPRRGAWMSKEQAKSLKKSRSDFVKSMDNKKANPKTNDIVKYVEWLKSKHINFSNDSRTDQISTYNMLGELVGGMPSPTSRIRPNDPCYCQSGKKYKKCHGLIRA